MSESTRREVLKRLTAGGIVVTASRYVKPEINTLHANRIAKAQGSAQWTPVKPLGVWGRWLLRLRGVQ